MRFETPLTEARLLRRYKRFLADVEIPGQGELTVLCPNPGSMLGLAVCGACHSKTTYSAGSMPIPRIPCHSPAA